MRGVRLWEVKNAVFDRRNRWDHSLCPLMGGVRLREVSVSGGSTVHAIKYEVNEMYKIIL